MTANSMNAEGSEIVKALKGHSGCEILLCKSPSGYFVWKIAGDSDYAPRLLRQADKQIALAAMLPLPAVYDIDRDGPKAGYKMEFVQGEDFRQVCLSRPVTWIEGFVGKLFQHFETLGRRRRNINLESAFQSKINSLCSAMTAVDLPQELSQKLYAVLESLRATDFSLVPASDCHGDMTLENLIFHEDGSFVFIDVLDGDLESVWLDIAKLLFDLEIGWSLRQTLWEQSNPESRVLRMISRYLKEEVMLKVGQDFVDVIPILPALKAIQALRILPYSSDAVTIANLTAYIANIA